MVNLPSLRYTRSLKNKWLGCESLDSLWHLLKVNSKKLKLAQQTPVYDVFTIRKKNGKDRLIENPNDHLKAIQRSINQYLQAVYYFVKHPASYGFCMAVKKDQYPHNLYTHAKQHIGCQYLLNADLKDFFHFISWQRVYDVFENSPFIHNNECKKWLCDITTHRERLPMGAPTSPVISNIAATGLDKALELFAKRHRFTYTRFADDLSFSSIDTDPAMLKNEILQTITEHGFVPNLEKVTSFGKKDIKIVTGLQVGDVVSLGTAYWQKVDMLLQQYISLKCLFQNRPTIILHNQTEEIKEKIDGFLAFAKGIGRSETDRIEAVENRLGEMGEELENFESLGWDEIPYHF